MVSPTSDDAASPLGVALGTHHPVDDRGRLLHEDDLVAQLALAVTNLEHDLIGAGFVPAELVELTVQARDPAGVGELLGDLRLHLAEIGAQPRVRLVEVARLPIRGMSVAVTGLARPASHQPERNSTMSTTEIPDAVDAETAAQRLRGLVGDVVHLPGHVEYDRLRAAWNVTALQRPAAVAAPASAAEVALVVRAAAKVGLRVAPQSTGHAAVALAEQRLDDVVLLRTVGLGGVSIDPATRIARVGAGVLWEEVIDAAAPYGLAAPHGSAPDIGVVGYTLGGGLGWFSRKHGLAASMVTAIELVTADGEHVRADAEHHQDLFWALRGAGGANFGIVTALEIELLPYADAYAGMLLWDISQVEDVFRTWSTWAETAPEEATTAFRVMRFPPIPELPPFLSGRSVVIVDGAFAGTDELAEGELAALRATGPELDTFGRVPVPALARMHMDPENPTPSVGGGSVLGAFDEAGIRAFLAAAGPESSTRLLMIELRQIGGALARPARNGGALAHLPGSYTLFMVGVAPTPEAAAAARADVDATVEALSPWASGGVYLNLAERRTDVSTAFGPQAWERLCDLRREHDPAGLLVANHAIEA